MEDLLFITHRLPYPPNRGDRIRTYHTLRYFAERFRVHLACLADEPVTIEQRQHLEELCQQVAIVPHRGITRWARGAFNFATRRTVTAGLFYSTDLTRVVERWCRNQEFAAVVASSSGLVEPLRVAARMRQRTLIDFIDVDSQKWVDYADKCRGIKRWFYRTEGRRLRLVEREIGRFADAVAVVSPDEASLLRNLVEEDKVHAIPNGVDLNYFHPTVQQQVQHSRCVFIGALDYWPNVQGIVWFCEHVWPTLKQRCPAATLEIVGRAPTPAVLELNKMDGVHVVGSVPDVRPHLHQSHVVIVPLWIARGVQNKVLEAFAAGKAVVSSPAALVGLDVESGTHVLQAETPAEWVNSIVEAIDNQSLNSDLGTAARLYVETRHSWDACLSDWEALLNTKRDRSKDWSSQPQGARV